MNEIQLPGLAHKVVVVTGAAAGQGLAECELLIANGADVVAGDLDEFASEGLEQLRGNGPGTLRYVQLDVAVESAWTALAESLSDRPVHGLVNNAAIPFRTRLGELKLEDWNRVLGVNLTGAMLGIQALVPLMIAGSSIVNVGSAAALTPHYTAAYTASKWGLRGLSTVAATEFGARGVRSNSVHPGYIQTAFMAAAPPEMGDIQLALTPLQRLGVPEDVANVVVFLLSDASSYMTGTEIPIDGGFTSSMGVKYMSDAVRALNAK